MQDVPTPEPAVPLAVVDALLGGLSDLLHDRAVQSLVAAGLLLETAVPADERDDLAERGLTAIGTAGQQARDAMWALTPPTVRRDRLAADLATHVGRLPAPEGGAAVVVELADDVGDDALEAVVAALHAVLAGVLVEGGRLLRVRLASDLVLQAVIAVEAGAGADGGDPAGPWMALAQARLTPLGGRVERSRRGGIAITDLAVPLAG